jgi:hypothetical protein
MISLLNEHFWRMFFLVQSIGFWIMMSLRANATKSMEVTKTDCTDEPGHRPKN